MGFIIYIKNNEDRMHLEKVSNLI